MGRVAAAYGVRGWIKVAPGGGVAQTLAASAQWWIGEHAYALAEARQHGRSVVAKLEGIDSREQVDEAWAALGDLDLAQDFVVTELAVHDLANGEWREVGLEVRNEQDEVLGTVKQWLSNGAQDVMEVAGSRTRLIPWASAIVKEVDLGAGRIVVDWQVDW